MTLARDLHFGFRTARRNSSFSLVIVLTLAVATGANTAVFTLVNTVVLRPLPYPEPGGLVLLNETGPTVDGMSVAWLNYLDWRDQNQAFEAMAAYREASYTLTSVDRPVRLSAAEVSAGFFEILGVHPYLGRLFEPADDHATAARVAVVSYGVWESRLGGNPDVLSKSIRLDRESFRVIGILPAEFDFTLAPDEPGIYVPIGLHGFEWTERGRHLGLYAVARLREGVTIESARSDMSGIAHRLGQDYPATNAGHGVRIRPLHDAITRNVRKPLLILLSAVGCVLVIACFNIASLLLARAAARRPEMALRAAVGAGRFQVARQLMAESLALSVSGGAVGALLGVVSTRALLAWLPAGAPRVGNIALDWRVLLFAAVICLLTGFVFGLAPAVASTRGDLNSVLKEGGLGGSGQRSKLRHGLIVVQMAVATMLLVGAGLLLRSFYNAVHADPGFDPSNTLIASFSMPESEYTERHRCTRFVEQLLAEVQSLPGVEAAGVATPLLGGWRSAIFVEDRPAPDPGQQEFTDIGSVSPDYLAALRVPLLRGRYFYSRDRADSPPVAIVDETFAERYWPSDNPVGKRVKLGRLEDPNLPWYEVVGVVGHVKNYGVDRESRIEMYIPYFREPMPGTTLVVRASTDPGSLASAVTSRLRTLDGQIPLYNVGSMEDLLGKSESIAPRRLTSALLSVFAAAALLLAAIGLYGLLSFSVARRHHEIGVRMALGESRLRVVSSVMEEGCKLAAVGLGIGLAASFALAHMLESQLFGVAARDAAIFAVVALLLAVVAAGAALLPARRAAAIDPIIALRYE